MGVVDNKLSGKMTYNYIVKANDERGINLALSNFAYGLDTKVISRRYPFLNNVGDDERKKALLYVICNTPFDGEKMAEALNKSELSTGWYYLHKDKNTLFIGNTDSFGNKSIIRVIKSANTSMTQSKMEDYERRALQVAERFGIVQYRVRDNLMIWNVSYPAYLQSKRYTVQHQMDLDTMRETTKRLARYDRKGEMNRY